MKLPADARHTGRRFYQFIDGQHPESRLVEWAGMRLYEVYPSERDQYEQAPIEMAFIQHTQ